MTTLSHYRAPKLQMSWQMLIALMVNILSLALPIMMLQVYDRIIPHQAYGTLTLLVIGVVTALVFDAALRGMRGYLAAWTAARHEDHASGTAIDHFLDADIDAFEAHETGMHLQNMTALSRLREFYSGQAMMAIIDLPFALMFLGLIAYIGGWLAVVPLGLLIAFVCSAYLTGNVLKSALDARSESENRKSGFIVSILTVLHTVKAKGMEALMMRRYAVHQADATQGSFDVAAASGNASLLGSVFGQLSLILTVTVGCYFVINGNLSVGGLSACTLLAGRTIQPVQRVLGAWLRLQDLDISRHQAENLFAMPVLERGDQVMPLTRGEITIRQLTFGHIKHEAPLFSDISLTISPNEIVAIKGDKGSGKTTFLELIAGIHKPDKGSIVIDDINPAEYRMSNLTNAIGYLPQQGTIFNGTLLENLTGFREDDFTIQAAKDMAKELGLIEIIDQLPHGYATKLTDSTSDPIPPGVKQRIALVRVLLHHPKIILFDDADRTLDKDGYNLLFRLLGNLKGRRTMVIASHDENLLSIADRSFVLHRGNLIPEVENKSQRVVYLNQMQTERF